MISEILHLFERGVSRDKIRLRCSTQLKHSNGALISCEPFYINTALNKLLNKLEEFNLILNSKLGFKKSPLLKCLLMTFINILFTLETKTSHILKPQFCFTGPGMLTKTYREYIENKMKLLKLMVLIFLGRSTSNEGAKYRFKDIILRF